MKRETIFVVLLLFLMVSCDKRKYTIKDSNGDYYHTDSYEVIEGGCIKFKDRCSSDETDEGMYTKICGSYTIEENKIEDK